MTRKRIVLVAAACPFLIPLLAFPCFLFWFHNLRCGPTFYSEKYGESKFLSLRKGMTAREVEAIIGPPLERIPHADGSVLWTYSNREDDTCSFDMCWVYFKDDRVSSVTKMRWEE